MTHNEALRMFVYNALKGEIVIDDYTIGVYDVMKPTDDDKLLWVLITTEQFNKTITNAGDFRQCTCTIQIIVEQPEYVNKKMIDDIAEQIEDKLMVNGVGISLQDDNFSISNLRYSNANYSIGTLGVGNTKTIINKTINLAASVAKKYN